jgi:hypothetical protein
MFQSYSLLRTEVLTAVKTLMLLFCVVTPCGLVSEEQTATIYRDDAQMKI